MTPSRCFLAATLLWRTSEASQFNSIKLSAGSSWKLMAFFFFSSTSVCVFLFFFFFSNCSMNESQMNLTTDTAYIIPRRTQFEPSQTSLQPPLQSQTDRKHAAFKPAPQDLEEGAICFSPITILENPFLPSSDRIYFSFKDF